MICDSVESLTNGTSCIIWLRKKENLILNFKVERDSDVFCPEDDVSKLS
jgi:hypothetical protein